MNAVTKLVFIIAAAIAVSGFVGSAAALALGIGIALTLGNPFPEFSKSLTPRLLTIAVMGLGLDMNLVTVAKAGIQGFGYTALGIGFAFGAGYLLRRLFKADGPTALLITVGTAICGGSAIAATAPVIRARHHEVTVALATVFLLNAIALMIFPLIGHGLDLTQVQFGLWSALAIHDTSSVVGASLQYGAQALEVGTTVKLARALWIVPVVMLISQVQKGPSEDETAPARKHPWFILGFLVAAALVTFIPELKGPGSVLAAGAKRLLVLTLFLIGSGLTRASIRTVGVRPLAFGTSLWVIIATATLGAIKIGWIH